MLGYKTLIVLMATPFEDTLSCIAASSRLAGTLYSTESTFTNSLAISSPVMVLISNCSGGSRDFGKVGSNLRLKLA